VFRDREGLAAAASYQSVLDAERNPEVFSNTGGIRPDQPAMPYMIDMDDPEHLLRRKLVNAGFTRKQLMDKVSGIQTLCDALIDAVCERGECDFVRDIAAPLPMAVIGDMLGVLPADRATLLKWSDDLVCGLSASADEAALQALMEAFAGYQSFAMRTTAERRAEPTGDLFSILVNSEVDGQRMSDDEIVFETLLILIGGDETTRHTLTGGVEQLLRHPDQWQRVVADPALVPGAVEEMLRWTAPVKNMARTVMRDNDFHGTQLRAGEKMLLLFESANFDESVFGDPENFRIDRTPNAHLAFGFGTHFCLGNQLARLELTTMLRTIARRLPDLRLAGDSALPLRPANFVSGLEEMPVLFTPSAPLTG
jgi:cytochrome P450 family 142 subfamily A polypeptide 1